MSDNFNEMFDFGFTAVTEEELEVVQKATQVAEETNATVAELQLTIDALQSKLDKLYSAIQPFFKNLKANPEKDYIYWKGQDRVTKIDQFNSFLKKIKEE